MKDDPVLLVPSADHRERLHLEKAESGCRAGSANLMPQVPSADGRWSRSAENGASGRFVPRATNMAVGRRRFGVVNRSELDGAA
jgi:hypothetical protein